MTNAEQFEKFGYASLKNVLTHAQCDEFSKLMLLNKDQGKLFYNGQDKNDRYYSESYGGDLPELEEALLQITPRVSDELNVKMKIANSYARIYYNGGRLANHVDRFGLDYTMSITLFNNLDFEWPLWCIDKMGNTVPINIDKGDGGIMYGTQIEHWRDNLICDPDQYVVQLFMHWSFVD